MFSTEKTAEIFANIRNRQRLEEDEEHLSVSMLIQIKVF